MVITEAELREMWRDGRGAIPPFPPGTRFSPAAQDFLKAHGLQVDFTESPTPQPLIPNPPPLTPGLRARLDSLHATLLLAGAHARRFRLPELAARLGTLAEHCREIGEAERDGRLPAPLQGTDDSPGEAARTPPAPDDHEMLLWLNYARAQAREAEAAAQEAAGPPEVSRALRRLGAAVDDLDRQFRAGTFKWKIGDW